MLRRNEYIDLHNGYTYIKCLDSKSKQYVNAKINTEIAPFIISLNVEWKSWTSANVGASGKQIAGTDLESKTRSNIILKKVIGEYYFGKGKHFILIDDDFLNLTKENYLPIKPGTFSSKEVINQLKALRAKSKNQKGSKANNSTKLITYKNKELFVEKGEVIAELDQKYIDAILANHGIIKDIETRAISNNVQIVKYGDKLLFSEEDIVVAEVNQKYLELVFDKHHIQKLV